MAAGPEHAQPVQHRGNRRQRVDLRPGAHPAHGARTGRAAPSLAAAQRQGRAGRRPVQPGPRPATQWRAGGVQQQPYRRAQPWPYVQDQVRLNDQWQLLVGLRHDRFEVDTTSKVSGLSEKQQSNSTSPRLGVVWTPLRDHAFYASWSKTFSPVGGGLIGITPGAAGNANETGPEHTRQKEIGVKSEWLDERLSTTLAVYELELYDRRSRDPDNADRYILTGLQRSRGVELTATGKLGGNWYVRGGIGLQDATIVEDTEGNAGNRINDVARRNASLFVTWKPEMGWYAETGVTLVGQRYADTRNTIVLPGYGSWDALVGWRTQDWDVRAALSNIADKTYYSSATSAGQIQFGDPRSLVVTGTYNF
nr:TonB-dependent receptor [Pseudomonas putida]